MEQTKPATNTADKHTPGPWTVTHQTNTDYSWDVVHEGQVVATCGYTQDKDSNLAANARLIAAAPELLAACKKLMRLQHVQFVGSSEGNPINRDSIVAFAQSILAKAEPTS